MSDRKYRQRGYQDDSRDREPKSRPTEKRPQSPRDRAPGNREPSKINMPGFRDVIRCTRCGGELSLPIGLDATCSRCGTQLHSCAQCASFDSSARFECMQAIPARVSPKDSKNECDLYQAKVTVERQTHSTGPTGAKKAFDDLFR